jgi:signal transduction histidine kinase
MFTNSWRRLFNSVFTQLLLICLVSGLVIISLVWAFFSYQFKKSKEEYAQRYVNQYLKLVVKDLGQPPSFGRAREIAGESGLQTRYEGAQASWTTSDKVPAVPVHHLPTADGVMSFSRPGHERFRTTVVRQGSDVFVMTFKNPELAMGHGWRVQIVILILLLAAVVLICYLAILYIMRPLKYISAGVQQISDGLFDYQVPTGQSNEFGRLAEGFNTMTVRVRGMLHANEQLLLAVSHEMRSPLTRMKVALAMQADSRANKGIADDVRELETLVAEILEEARLRHAAAGHLKKEAILVKELFQDLEALHQGQLPGLLVAPVSGSVTIPGDPSLVRIVLNNVIANALKYSPADGVPVSLGCREGAGCTVLLVQDWGGGIPGEDLPYLFEPFYRVDKSRSKRTGGYGLGLSLCKTIMDAHQEKIEVQSILGVGTTISLTFTNKTP